MKQVELTLSLLLPVLLIIAPISLPFLTLIGAVHDWLSIVFLLSVYSSTYLIICTPRITKPTTRLSNIKLYLTKEILLIVGSNFVFSYFISGLANIWFTDTLDVNLSLFWSTVTAQYFMFDSLINFKYRYQTSVVKVRWFSKLRLNLKGWMKESSVETLKMGRYVLPLYVLLYKDITAFTSISCGSPVHELSYYFLMRPSTFVNIFKTAFLTHLLLNVGHKAVLHTVNNSTIPKVKGKISVEKCVENLRSGDVPTRYHALADLLCTCRTSYSSRQSVFSLQDGHPVLWHIIYKEWINALNLFNSSLSSKPAQSPDTTSAKTEISRPTCRPLVQEKKATQLYSLKDTAANPSVPDVSNSSKLSTLVTNVASDAVISFKKSAREFFLSSRIGKYLLTELSDRVQENKLADVGFLRDGAALCEVLCCAAQTEDRFGVVQLVLPEILDTLTATLKALEQGPIVPTTVSHTHLKRSLHLFLHHVTGTYQNTLFNLSVSSDTAATLQHYLHSS